MFIQDTYTDAIVLVTGGTGYVGKGVVEKLLRTCTKVREVVLMIRARRGLTAAQRLERLKQDVVFERIRAENPDALNKLSVVDGDISVHPSMGLSACDKQRLLERVNFVFHSAATVNFNLPFEETSNRNILGTKRMLDLSLKMTNLKCFQYVSTAYTGILNPIIKENVHPPKKPIDMDSLLNVLITGTPTEQLREALQYQDQHPNTYTFSKFFAEHLVEHYFQKYAMPICIVRPSIIVPAFKEPMNGWVDNFNGMVGLSCEVSRGAIGCIYANGDTQIDGIPIDFVCNLMLTAAWWTVQHPSTELAIYNHSSMNQKPIPVKVVFEDLIKYGRLYPSRYTFMYPSAWVSTNPIVMEYCKLFYQMLPAFVYDLALRLDGKKPIAVDLAKKLNTAVDYNRYFLTTDFQMTTDNVLRLIAASKRAADANEFDMDVREVDIHDYNRIVWHGIRRFLLKEPPTTDERRARDYLSRVNWMCRLYAVVQMIVVGGFMWTMSRFVM